MNKVLVTAHVSKGYLRYLIQVIQAVTFSCPSWRSLSHLKGPLNHPKKVTKNCQDPAPSSSLPFTVPSGPGATRPARPQRCRALERHSKTSSITRRVFLTGKTTKDAPSRTYRIHVTIVYFPTWMVDGLLIKSRYFTWILWGTYYLKLFWMEKKDNPNFANKK